MLYYALFLILLFALSVGSKFPGAGVLIAIVGAGTCFLIRAWYRWNQQREAEGWKRRSEELREQRQRNIQLEMERTQIKVVTAQTHEPIAYVDSNDAIAAARASSYGVVRAGHYFFLTTRTPTDSELIPVQTYIENRYNTTSNQTELSPIHLLQPSAEAVALDQERKRAKQEEQDRILSARLSDVESRSRVDLGADACSLYIMASKAAIKVGISNRPEDRLRQVQTRHHAHLRLHKVWWFQSTADAALLERTVHGQLKVRGSHSSGEWFNISAQDAVRTVSEAIKALSGNGEIDKGLLPALDSPLGSLELTLGKLLNHKWNESKKGNEYLRLPGNSVTVFRRKKSWSFVHNDTFSDNQFPTKEAAKAAALRQVLKSTTT